MRYIAFTYISIYNDGIKEYKNSILITTYLFEQRVG